MEDYWREAKARGIAAAFCDDRAISQWFPNRATDHIPIFEQILGITPSAADSDEDRRQAILDRWTREGLATTSDLEEALQDIDALFSIGSHDRDTERGTVPGRGFEDFSPSDPDSSGPAFGTGLEYTNWPNFSDSYICYVRYNLSAGTLSQEQIRRINRAKSLLSEVLPAWVRYQVAGATAGGFLLDISLLDIGVFNP